MIISYDEFVQYRLRNEIDELALMLDDDCGILKKWIAHGWHNRWEPCDTEVLGFNDEDGFPFIMPLNTAKEFYDAMVLHSVQRMFQYADVMTRTMFIDAVDSGGITEEDGRGYWYDPQLAYEPEVDFHCKAWPKHHYVVWFNR